MLQGQRGFQQPSQTSRTFCVTNDGFDGPYIQGIRDARWRVVFEEGSADRLSLNGIAGGSSRT